jgi:hypothetical protein
VASPSWYQFLTIAGALTVVNSVLIGGTLGLQDGTGALAAPAPVGVITGTGADGQARPGWRLRALPG